MLAVRLFFENRVADRALRAKAGALHAVLMIAFPQKHGIAAIQVGIHKIGRGVKCQKDVRQGFLVGALVRADVFSRMIGITANVIILR